MPAYKCPTCKTVVFIPEDVKDYVHDCAQAKPDQATSYEDVPNIGAYEDYDGSGGQPSAKLLQGIENTQDLNVQAKAAGVNIDDKTDRGNRSSTHRTRGRLTYFETK